MVRDLKFYLWTLTLCCLAAHAWGADWPMLGRDGTRNSVSPEPIGPTDWAIGKFSPETGEWIGGRNIRWRAPLGSLTFGDPVVVDGQIWIGTNNHQVKDPDAPDASVLAGFATADGKPLYRYVSPRLPSGWVHDWPNSAMAGAPLIEGNAMWFVTNRGEVVCLDLKPLKEGKDSPAALWKVDMMKEFGVSPCGSRMHFCHFCSIAVYNDLIYVITGNGIDKSYFNIPSPDAPSLICFNKHTGEPVWQDNSPGMNILTGQWASPLVIEVDGRPQVVVPQGDGWLRSFDALNGKMIWEFDINFKSASWNAGQGGKNIIMAPPVAYGGRVYVTSGDYPEHGDGPGRLVCIDPNRAGDFSTELALDANGDLLPKRRTQAVLVAEGEKSVPNPNSGLVWEYTEFDSNGDGEVDFEETLHRSQSSVAIKDGLVIACDFAGFVHCFDAETGKRHWTYDMFSLIYAPPLIVGDLVYVGNVDGDLAVFRLNATPQKEPIFVGRFRSPIYVAPIFVDGVLYVASRDTLFAVEMPATPIRSQTEGFWPQWRGPLRNNQSTDENLLQEWPVEGPPLLWRAKGLGDGIASVSIADGKIYTLSYFEGDEFVLAISEQTGERVWQRRIGPETPMGKLMRWFSQRSPTLDGDRLYATTADGNCLCLAAETGEELWRISYPEQFASRKPTWGFCDYPLVDGDRLIIAPGGDTASMVALDKLTGKVVWQTLIPDAGRCAYGATVSAEIAGVRQYLSFLEKGLVSVNAADGRLLWRYDENASPIANTYTPLIHGATVYLPNGYGAVLAALQVSADRDELFSVRELYRADTMFDAFEDATVMLENRLFSFRKTGIPVCLDLKNGELLWPVKRPSGTGKAAMTFADGKLYTLHASGHAALVEVSADEYEEKGTLLLPDHQPSHGATFPVVTAGRLYLRDNDSLYCYSIRRGELVAAPQTVQQPPLSLPKLPEATAPRPGERSPRSVYVPTPQDVVEKMLALAEPQKTDIVIDLGSGDGRIVIAAAKMYGCKAIGYELDMGLVESSRVQATKNGVDELVVFEAKDLFDADLTNVQVVTLYLLPKQLETLLPKLRQMKPGVKIVAHQFPLPGLEGLPLEPDMKVEMQSTEDGDLHTIYLWTTPLKVDARK